MACSKKDEPVVEVEVIPPSEPIEVIEENPSSAESTSDTEEEVSSEEVTPVDEQAPPIDEPTTPVDEPTAPINEPITPVDDPSGSPDESSSLDTPYRAQSPSVEAMNVIEHGPGDILLNDLYSFIPSYDLASLASLYGVSTKLILDNGFIDRISSANSRQQSDQAIEDFMTDQVKEIIQNSAQRASVSKMIGKFRISPSLFFDILFFTRPLSVEGDSTGLETYSLLVAYLNDLINTPPTATEPFFVKVIDTYHVLRSFVDGGYGNYYDKPFIQIIDTARTIHLRMSAILRDNPEIPGDDKEEVHRLYATSEFCTSKNMQDGFNRNFYRFFSEHHRDDHVCRFGGSCRPSQIDVLFGNKIRSADNLWESKLRIRDNFYHSETNFGEEYRRYSRNRNSPRLNPNERAQLNYDFEEHYEGILYLYQGILKEFLVVMEFLAEQDIMPAIKLDLDHKNWLFFGEFNQDFPLIRPIANEKKSNNEEWNGSNMPEELHRGIDSAFSCAQHADCFTKGPNLFVFNKIDGSWFRSENLESEIPGLPVEFQDGFDAAVRTGDKLWIFKGPNYIRADKNYQTLRYEFRDYTDPVSGTVYPASIRKISDYWKGVNFDKVDAALNRGNGKVFLFSGSQYIRYDMGNDEADEGYPREINTSTWENLESATVEAAL